MTLTAQPRSTEAPPAYAGAESPAAKVRGFRFGLRLKFLLFVSIALVGIGLIFGWAFSRQLDLTLRREFQKRGETLVRGLAANSWLDLYSGDKARLVRLVAGALEEPDVIAVAIHDAGKKVDARVERIAGALLPAASLMPKAIEVHVRTIATGPILAFVAPIRLQASGDPGGAAGGAADPFALLEPTTGPKPTDVLGSAEVVFGLTGVERQIGEVQRTTTIVTAVIVAMGIILIVLLSRVFITPIERIAFLARCIAEGDRTCVAEVERTDELGELADAFNTMTATLRSQEDELRRMNVGLEQKVRERTMDLEVKQQAILAANVELERASRLKSEFLANMSHELRTPLNAVNGFSELLLEQKHGELTVRQKRYVDNILSSGRHLLQLINDILDLAKIEAGRVDVRWEVFSLRHVIETAVSVIQPVAQKKGLEVEVRFDPAVDRVELDSGRTKQILYNLVSNAVKFTDEGQITISARPGAAGGVEIEVADTGIGIQPEDQARIFREFEQVDGSHSRRYEGTGLGLALTRKLVELQGGSIRVESELRKGSRFIVFLPTSRSQAEAHA